MHRKFCHKTIGAALLAFALTLFATGGAYAAKPDPLADRLTPERLDRIFPGAESVGQTEGRPPSAPVEIDDDLAGYVLSVADVTKIKGYSGRPFDILLGLDLDGFVTGADLIEQNEPLFRNTRRDRTLEEAVAGLVGLDILAARPTTPAEFAGRANASALVMLDAIYRAGHAVAVARELKGPGEREGRRLDMATYRPLDWRELRAMGAVRRLSLTNGDLAAADDAIAGSGPADMPFVTLYAALATPPLIGRNLLGDTGYEAALEARTAGDQLLLLAADGRVPLLDSGLAAPVETGRTLLRLRQADVSLPLDASLLHAVVDGLQADGAPQPQQIALARIPAATGFDETKPWTLELAVGAEAAETIFALPYFPPAQVIQEPIHHLVAVAVSKDMDMPPLWISVWMDRSVGIAILVASLIVLVAIILMQGRLARHPRVLTWVRNGFLVFTLVWIGWYAAAQISVMHLISLVQAPVDGRDLDALLLDPLTVILLAFVGLSLLLLGRGVFCGWLCPFGALQELTNKIARRLGVRQWRLPQTFNDRLWSLKYVLLLALIGLSFIDPESTAGAVEIEPFTTAILFGFTRALPYTIFALGILGAGLFVERFFCRYLCPLGAGLAIVGRWRMVAWLKRRPECGRSCNTCQSLCPVQAIGDDGAINLNECYQCLSCQVAYSDNHVCPPLVSRRERIERLSGGEAFRPLKAAAPAE